MVFSVERRTFAILLHDFDVYKNVNDTVLAILNPKLGFFHNSTHDQNNHAAYEIFLPLPQRRIPVKYVKKYYLSKRQLIIDVPD